MEVLRCPEVLEVPRVQPFRGLPLKDPPSGTSCRCLLRTGAGSSVCELEPGCKRSGATAGELADLAARGNRIRASERSMDPARSFWGSARTAAAEGYRQPFAEKGAHPRNDVGRCQRPDGDWVREERYTARRLGRPPRPGWRKPGLS